MSISITIYEDQKQAGRVYAADTGAKTMGGKRIFKVLTDYGKNGLIGQVNIGPDDKPIDVAIHMMGMLKRKQEQDEAKTTPPLRGG